MTEQAISPLRRRMIEDMTIGKFAQKTQHDYVQQVKGFQQWSGTLALAGFGLGSCRPLVGFFKSNSAAVQIEKRETEAACRCSMAPRSRLWVKGCRCGYVGGTFGVPRLLTACRITQLGSLRPRPERQARPDSLAQGRCPSSPKISQQRGHGQKSRAPGLPS
jgi:hypothetical protein